MFAALICVSGGFFRYSNAQAELPTLAIIWRSLALILPEDFTS
jgi:hypothetical protein